MTIRLKDKKGYSLFVSNLPRDLNSGELKSFFELHSPVHATVVMEGGVSKCFGYVDFSSKEEVLGSTNI
jgi:RNA recognition motif-containing protein